MTDAEKETYVDRGMMPPDFEYKIELPKYKLPECGVACKSDAEQSELSIDWNAIAKQYAELGISTASCICASTAEDSLCCSKSREAELAEELEEKDAEIERLKHVARKLEDDVKFEQMVRDALARDCAAAVELAGSLKKKIEYCKKNGIWAEEA